MNAVNPWLIRLSRHIGIYGTGAIANVLVGVVSVAITTRFLPPSGFGKLGVLLAFQGFLTVFYDLGTIQGTFRRTFGHGGGGDDGDDGDDGGDDLDDDEGEGLRHTADKRRALGTGLVLCVVISSIGAGVLALFSTQAAQFLTGDPGDGDLVLIAAGGASANAVWRLTLNVIRLERRPVTNVTLASLRPLLMAAGTIVFLAADKGVPGALAGNALGSAACVVLALAVSWRSYRPNFDVRGMLHTYQVAARWIPLVIGFYVINHGDLIILSRLVSDHDVGIYRLASRVGGVISFYVGAIISAWNPLRRTAMFAAAREELGTELGATLIFYYWLISGWVIIILSAGADLLVKVGPPAYADAAPLIPLTGGGLVAYGGFMTMYRGAVFPNRPKSHVIVTVIAALVFIASALLLVPITGVYGTALATLIAFMFGTLVTFYQSQRGPFPLPLRYGRLAAVVAMGAVGVVVAEFLAPLTGELEPVLDLLVILAYPIVVLVAGVLPPEHRSSIVELLHSMFRRQTTPSDELLGRVAALAPADRQALELVVRTRETPAGAAATVGESELELSARLGRAVCQASDVPQVHARDAQLGRYLFASGAVAQVDLLAHDLMSDKVIRPKELSALEATVKQLRRIPADTWPTLEREDVHVDPLELEEQGVDGAIEVVSPPVGVNGRWEARSGNGHEGELRLVPADGAPRDGAPGDSGPAPSPEEPGGDRLAPPPTDHPADWVAAPPDFIGVGVSPAGGRRWFDLIVAHPDVSPPTTPRPSTAGFFEQFAAGGRSPKGLADYERYFARPPGQLTGEWGDYLRHFWVPGMLLRAAPEAMLIVCLRDPIERYRAQLGRHRRETGAPPDAATVSDAANRGLYFQHLRRLLREFGEEQLLILQYEACREDPEGQLRRTYEYLGLDYVDPGAAALAPPPEPVEGELPRAEWRDLLHFYATDVRGLARHVDGIDLRLWPNFGR